MGSILYVHIDQRIDLGYFSLFWAGQEVRIFGELSFLGQEDRQSLLQVLEIVILCRLCTQNIRISAADAIIKPVPWGLMSDFLEFFRLGKRMA